MSRSRLHYIYFTPDVYEDTNPPTVEGDLHRVVEFRTDPAVLRGIYEVVSDITGQAYDMPDARAYVLAPRDQPVVLEHDDRLIPAARLPITHFDTSRDHLLPHDKRVTTVAAVQDAHQPLMVIPTADVRKYLVPDLAEALATQALATATDRLPTKWLGLKRISQEALIRNVRWQTAERFAGKLGARAWFDNY